MKTKTINCLLFSELSEEQKAKAIEKHRDINTFGEWWDWELDEQREKLTRQGFINPQIYFSLSYSQGDGACFQADIDLAKFLKGRRVATKYTKQIENYHKGILEAKITTSGHYSHEYSMSLDYYDQDDAPSGNLETFILEEAREQARKIYKDLKALYEDLTSDESIAETLENNEYYFNSETLEIESI